MPDRAPLDQLPVWHTPAARDLALWLVALTAPALLFRPFWAVRVAWVALVGRKAPRG
jgi:hypothetical protein